MEYIERIKHGVDLTKFKAEQAIRVNHIQGEIGELRKEISTVKEMIALTALELYKDDAISNQELQTLCLKIDELNEKINEKEILITSIKAEKSPSLEIPTQQSVPINPCPNCSNDVPELALFCPSCGSQMPQISKPQSKEVISQTTQCDNCGFAIPLNAVFCPDCGQKNPNRSEFDLSE